jgi:hypothetical protein
MRRLRFRAAQSEPQSKFVPQALQLTVDRLVHNSILRVCRNIIWAPIRQRYGQFSVAEAFTQTYRNKLWGGIEGSKFFSGRGSLDKFATPYVEWLIRYISKRDIKTVVDLGCGGFRIGQRICSAISVNYVSVDIVPEFIAYNHSQFGSERVNFKCANMAQTTGYSSTQAYFWIVSPLIYRGRTFSKLLALKPPPSFEPV